MDLTSKGISWVGNVYQKLETMCVDVCQEMDNYIAQEHSKFVKKQVESVGINVQCFYNEVLQDLLPPVDSVKGPLSDLSLIYDLDAVKEQAVKESPQSDKIPDADLNGAPSSNMPNLESVNDASTGANDGENTCNSMNEYSSSGPTNNEYIIPEGGEDCRKCVSMETTSIDESPITLSVEVTSVVESTITYGSDFGSAFPLESLDSHLSFSTNDIPSVSTGSFASGAEMSGVASIVTLTSRPTALSGTSNNKFCCNEQYASKVLCDTMEEEIGDYEDVTLGESYLDAGEEEFDNDISIVCRQAAMPKSYKKKLRDVLLSKFRSAKIQDYRQLEIMSVNLDKSAVEEESQKPITLGGGVERKPKMPSNQNICEPDWELV